MHESNITVQPKRLRKLLQRLVDIYSPSGKEEEILGFVQGYLKRRGFYVQTQPVDDHRYNILVLPPETEVLLAFIGHLDTVAAYDLDNYGYGEREDLTSGLGVADMKGGCAAMIEAFTTFKDSGYPDPPVALCLLVGEEEEGDGARQLVKDFHFPWAVVGEPTDLRPCLSHYGYLEIHVSTIGKRMHASLANTKRNPVEVMLRLLFRVSRYMEKERPDLIYNIRDLYSSQAGFVVPDRCEGWLDVHMPPSSPTGEILAELDEILVRQKEDSSFIENNLRIVTVDSGYELPMKGFVVEAMKAVFEGRSILWEPQAFISHSDANQLWAAGVKPVLLGPGRLEDAHIPEESISFQQVCLASQLYLDLSIKMLNFVKEGGH